MKQNGGPFEGGHIFTKVKPENGQFRKGTGLGVPVPSFFFKGLAILPVAFLGW